MINVMVLSVRSGLAPCESLADRSSPWRAPRGDAAVAGSMIQKKAAKVQKTTPRTLVEGRVAHHLKL